MKMSWILFVPCQSASCTSTKLSFHDFMSFLDRLITFSDVFQIYYEGRIFGALISFSFITKVKSAKVQNWALIFHLPIISRKAIDFVRILTRCHYHRGSYFGIQNDVSHKFLSNKSENSRSLVMHIKISPTLDIDITHTLTKEKEIPTIKRHILSKAVEK